MKEHKFNPGHAPMCLPALLSCLVMQLFTESLSVLPSGQ